MSLKSELQEIHEALVGNFAAKFKEGNWWGHDTDLGEQKEAFDQAAQATLQTFIEELESLYLDNKMFIHMKGDLARKIAELRGIDEETLLKDMQHKLVEQKVADVRKVIKEDKMSNCCNAQVYDPSGLGIEGRCKDCLEMCLIVGGNNE